jgi:hypothetical protein
MWSAIAVMAWCDAAVVDHEIAARSAPFRPLPENA